MGDEIRRPLVEVFSVSINHIDGENLYGTITVTDARGSQSIYNRSRDHYESISPGQPVLLTGPARSILACDSVAIDVALKDKDDDVSSKQTWWNPYLATPNKYDEPLYDDFPLKNGSVTVNYVVLSIAFAATVEVTFVNRGGEGENSAHVYGLLTARNGNLMNESVLFRKKSDEHVDVRPEQPIPLSRSVVAVPSDSSLIVRADLMDHDGEIAKGTAEFPAQLSGTSQKNIFGQHGEIRVKIMLDPQGMSKGSGFVAFSTSVEATRALNAMNGKMIGHKPLYVAVAQHKDERRAQLQLIPFEIHFSGFATSSLPVSLSLSLQRTTIKFVIETLCLKHCGLP